MKCPGQDTRYWKPGDIFDAPCPDCGTVIEFFKDDAVRKCRQCGTKVLNPKIDFGCASYCAFAEECLRELTPEMLAQRKAVFKDRVAAEMKRYFGTDGKRINHALKVAEYAEKILSREHGDLAVVLTAAYLHDIGIKEAEKQYQSTSARYQEELGPPIARQLLDGLGADRRLTEEVCDIIGHHHHPREEETDNFKVLYDADLIVNIEEGDVERPRDREKIKGLIEKAFLTQAGKALAGERFLKSTEC